MTEDEAKKKWCPYSRVLIADDRIFGTGNRFYEEDRTPAGVNCLGSACMAWRWATYANRGGYCGLAGRADR